MPREIVYYEPETRELVTDSYPVAPGARWDDMRFPAAAINTVGPGGNADFDPNTGLLTFDENIIEYVTFQVQMPHNWVSGTELKPHVHWLQAAGGLPYWKLDYRIAAPGASWPGSWTTIGATSNVFPYSSGTIHQISRFPAIDMAAYEGTTSVMFACLFSRDPTDDLDTQPEEVSLLEVDIHYLKRTDGSTGEFSGGPAGR